AAVVTQTSNTLIAVSPPNSRSDDRLIRGAGSDASRYELREVCKKISHNRVAINALEQVRCMVANITDLDCRVFAGLALNTQRPGVHSVGTEIWRHAGLRELAWVEYTRREERGVSATYARSVREGGQRFAVCRCSRKGLQENLRS